MLEIVFPKTEFFDNDRQIFITIKGGTFHFEHSLLSISKWESRFKKPFLVPGEKTMTEWYGYILCMVIEKNFNPQLIMPEHYKKILEYIQDSRTATKIKSSNNSPNSSYVSSELLYANMAQMGIPFEADRWHVSRLMALLGIISEQNQPADKRKMSESETIEFQHNLNIQRREELRKRKEAEKNNAN